MKQPFRCGVFVPVGWIWVGGPVCYSDRSPRRPYKKNFVIFHHGTETNAIGSIRRYVQKMYLCIYLCIYAFGSVDAAVVVYVFYKKKKKKRKNTLPILVSIKPI